AWQGVPHALFQTHTIDLGQRDDSLAGQFQRSFSQWAHAVPAGLLLNILGGHRRLDQSSQGRGDLQQLVDGNPPGEAAIIAFFAALAGPELLIRTQPQRLAQDRKSTRLNSSHVKISYAVFCLNKKKK